MVESHIFEVQRRYNEQVQVDSVALNADPDVMDASQALESARRALNLDRHNPERQQHLRDCEKNYLSVTNSYHRNAMLARLESEKETKRIKVEAQEAQAEERRKQLETMTPEKRALARKYSTML